MKNSNRIEPLAADAQRELVDLFNAGRLTELEARVRALLERLPDSGFLWKCLGTCLELAGKPGLDALRRAAELLPGDAEAQSNLGNALLKANRRGEALVCYRRAVAIRPDYAEGHYNLATLLMDLGSADQARAAFGRALELRADYRDAAGNRQLAVCYSPTADPQTLLAESLRLGERLARGIRPRLAWPNAPERDRRLRIGFVSADFFAHPVGYFLAVPLAELARSAGDRLELFAYSNGTRSDALSERLRASFAHWRSIDGRPDDAVAATIAADRIDILIDLSGHTAGNRLALFARRAAPVQISWLGYFATTGIATIDYLLADPWLLPAGEDGYCSETVRRLPQTRLCFSPPQAVVEPGPLPALANGYLTFGCCNNLAKLNDAVIALWARILAAVPSSRLLLKTKLLGDASVRAWLLERFAARGIAAARLLLEGAESYDAYLGAYRRIDIALDPIPFSGATTSLESLWMGVPVLTLSGRTMAARQGRAILMNLDLPEWVASDAEDYLARARRHAADIEALALLRRGLRERLRRSPLMDGGRFARCFADELRAIWGLWCDQQRGDPLPAAERDRLSAAFNAARYGEGRLQARGLIERFPDSAMAWKVLAACLELDGGDGLEAARRAVQLAPGDAEAQSNLGSLLQQRGRLDQAVASYLRALALAPDFAPAHHNLAQLRFARDEVDAAEEGFRKTIALTPGDALAHENLGVVLMATGRPQLAAASFRQALTVLPTFARAGSRLLLALACLPEVTPAALKAEAGRLGQMLAAQAQRHGRWENAADAEKTLRVGLVSGDLSAHPVGRIIAGVVAALMEQAPARLELIGYANQLGEDAVGERIKARCQGWRRIHDAPDERVAGWIREDRIDILLDLSGHTAHNRLPLFAWKAAPVQASWLGYPGTSGVAAIDYVIADAWTVPEGEDGDFSERVWRLPQSYLSFAAPDGDTEPGPLPALERGTISFGSVTPLSHINDRVIALWARILKAVPASRLLLNAGPLHVASVRQRLLERFAREGIAPNRLELKAPADRAPDLDPYREIDIGLDPSPCPGITTTLAALWMGVPVLSLAGKGCHARQGVGLLANAGLTDWIAHDEDDYVARAVAKARNPADLARLRQSLRGRLQASALLDRAGHARRLEAALRGMWRAWCAPGRAVPPGPTFNAADEPPPGAGAWRGAP